MGIGRVISAAVRDFLEITAEMWQDDNQDHYHCAAAGIVAIPIEDDKAITIKVNGDGSKTVYLGVVTDDDQGIQAGEIILYSRDGNGGVKSKVYLDKDGNIVFNDDADNAVRFSELKSGFDELRDDFTDFVTNTYNPHTHTGVTTGPGSSGTTASVGTGSAASVDNAKIDVIKVP